MFGHLAVDDMNHVETHGRLTLESALGNSVTQITYSPSLM